MADLIAQRLFDEYTPSAVTPLPTPPTPDHHIEVTNSLQRLETDLQSREATVMAQEMQDMMLTLMRSNGNQPTTTNHFPRSGGGDEQ
jgi:hypothetical protein